MKRVFVVAVVLMLMLVLYPWFVSGGLHRLPSEGQGIIVFNEAKELEDKARWEDDLEQALAKYQRALAIFRGVNSGQWEATTLDAIGGVYQKLASQFRTKAIEIRNAGNVSEPKAVLNSGSNNKALFVGVEEYADPRHNVPGNREDVRLLSEALVSKGAFSRQQVKVLLDRDASKANILKTFDEWLIHGTKPEDTVFFYFTGHSLNIWDRDELHSGLVPWDGKVTKDRERRTFKGRVWDAFALASTANVITDDELVEMTRELKGRNIIFIIDAGMGSLADFREHVQGKATKSVRRKPGESATEITQDAKLAVLAAASNSPSQTSNFKEPPKGPHSVYTWFLLKGLEGKADLNGVGEVTLGNLAKFVEEEVKREGYPQTPQHIFSPGSFENFTILRINRPGTSSGHGLSPESPSKLHGGSKGDPK